MKESSDFGAGLRALAADLDIQDLPSKTSLSYPSSEMPTFSRAHNLLESNTRRSESVAPVRPTYAAASQNVTSSEENPQDIPPINELELENFRLEDEVYSAGSRSVGFESARSNSESRVLLSADTGAPAGNAMSNVMSSLWSGVQESREPSVGRRRESLNPYSFKSVVAEKMANLFGGRASPTTTTGEMSSPEGSPEIRSSSPEGSQEIQS